MKLKTQANKTVLPELFSNFWVFFILLASFFAYSLSPPKHSLLTAQDATPDQSQAQTQSQTQTQTTDLKNLLEQIDTAQQLRNYNKALRLLQEAQQKFSQNPVVWLLSGQLYQQQNLLRLSLESYQKASELKPQNTQFLRRVALVQDRLGLYADAVNSYQKIENFGNRTEQNQARKRKGWLLYKLHRYPEAEASILAIPAQERNSSIMLTLAIIYAAAYDYEKSRKAYEQSIALTYPASAADANTILQNLEGSINQRALVYYDYALLEVNFLHFDRAMELNEKSLENASLASNELLRGELFLDQRKFSQAREAFLKSQNLEDLSIQPSPLALLDLVQLSIDQGSYKEGMVFFRELKKRFHNQTDWMSPYGTDPLDFELDLMQLQKDLYKGLLQEAKWFLPLNMGERLQNVWNILRYTWLHWFSSTRSKLLAYQVGKDHYLQGNTLDANQQLSDASDENSRIHKRYFSQLQKEHATRIPASKAGLLLEAGIVNRSAEQIQQSLKMLNPKWEFEELETAHIELSKLLPERRYEHILQAYALNPATLKKEGIRLPLQVQISGSSAYQSSQRSIERKLRSYLKRSGAQIADGAGLTLQIQWSSEQVKAYLLSPKGNVLRSIDSRELEPIMEGKKLSQSARRIQLKRFVRAFMQQAFTPKEVR